MTGLFLGNSDGKIKVLQVRRSLYVDYQCSAINPGVCRSATEAAGSLSAKIAKASVNISILISLESFLKIYCLKSLLYENHQYNLGFCLFRTAIL